MRGRDDGIRIANVKVSDRLHFNGALMGCLWCTHFGNSNDIIGIGRM